MRSSFMSRHRYVPYGYVDPLRTDSRKVAPPPELEDDAAELPSLLQFRWAEVGGWWWLAGKARPFIGIPQAVGVKELYVPAYICTHRL